MYFLSSIRGGPIFQVLHVFAEMPSASPIAKPFEFSLSGSFDISASMSFTVIIFSETTEAARRTFPLGSP